MLHKYFGTGSVPIAKFFIKLKKDTSNGGGISGGSYSGNADLTIRECEVYTAPLSEYKGDSADVLQTYSVDKGSVNYVVKENAKPTPLSYSITAIDHTDERVYQVTAKLKEVSHLYLTGSALISVETFPIHNRVIGIKFSPNWINSERNSINLVSVPHDLPEFITTTANMFNMCTKFSQSVGTTWDTTNVTDMSYMFYGCLMNDKAVYFNTINVTDMSYMFYNNIIFPGTIGFGRGRFTFDNVTSTASMFEGCASINGVIGTSDVIVSPKLTNASSMYKGCTKLTAILALDYSNVVNASSMCMSCTALKTIGVRTVFKKLEDASNMFAGSGLTDGLANLIFTEVAAGTLNADGMFRQVPFTSLTGLMENGDDKCLLNVNNMFTECPNLTGKLLKDWTLPNAVTAVRFMGGTVSAGVTHVFSTSPVLQNCKIFTRIFNGNTNFLGNYDYINNKTADKFDIFSAKAENVSAAFASCTNFNLPVFLAESYPVLAYTSSLFAYCSNFNREVAIRGAVGLVNLEAMFFACINLNSAITIECPRASVFTSLFLLCQRLNTEFNIDFSNATTCEKFMQECSAYNKPVTINNVNNRLTNLNSSFVGCGRLNSEVKVDMYGVQSAVSMFRRTQNFNHPCVKDYNMETVSNMTGMFTASGIKQDLSKWCVPSVQSAPGFNGNFTSSGVGFTEELTSLTPDQVPVWGTCPSKVPIDDEFFSVFIQRYKEVRRGYFSALKSPNGNPNTTITGVSVYRDNVKVSSIPAKGGYFEVPANNPSATYTFRHEYSGPSTLIDTYFEISLFREILSFGNKTRSFRLGWIPNGFIVPATLPKSVTTLDNAIRNCNWFNSENVAYWNTENVESAVNFLTECPNFKRPLISWCTTKMTSLPSGFASKSGLDPKFFPVWGTCSKDYVPEYGHTTLVVEQGIVDATMNIITNAPANKIALYKDGVLQSDATKITTTLNSPRAIYQIRVAKGDAGETYDVTIDGNNSSILEGVLSFDSVGGTSGIALIDHAANFYVPPILPSNITNLENCFFNCPKFNSSAVAHWFFTNVVKMDNFLKNAVTFNKSLALSCVPSILEVPKNFASGSGLVATTMPKWGVTPSRDIIGEVLTFDLPTQVGVDIVGSVCNNYDNVLSSNTPPTYTDVPVIVYDKFLNRIFSTENRDDPKITNLLLNSGVYYVFFEKQVAESLGKISFSSNASSTNKSLTTVNTEDGLLGLNISNFTTNFDFIHGIHNSGAGTPLNNTPDLRNSFSNCPAFTDSTTGVPNASVFSNIKFTNGIAFLEGTFRASPKFSQDLSQWCVTIVTTRPNGFGVGSGLLETQMPVWGTCPVIETGVLGPVFTMSTGSSPTTLSIGTPGLTGFFKDPDNLVLIDVDTGTTYATLPFNGIGYSTDNFTATKNVRLSFYVTLNGIEYITNLFARKDYAPSTAYIELKVGKGTTPAANEPKLLGVDSYGDQIPLATKPVLSGTPNAGYKYYIPSNVTDSIISTAGLFSYTDMSYISTDIVAFLPGDTIIHAPRENAYNGFNGYRLVRANVPSSKVSSTDFMFRGATNIPLDFSKWCMSTVTSMRNMFLQAEFLNTDVGTFLRSIAYWDVKNVTDMNGLFAAVNITKRVEERIDKRLDLPRPLFLKWDFSSINTPTLDLGSKILDGDPMLWLNVPNNTNTASIDYFNTASNTNVPKIKINRTQDNYIPSGFPLYFKGNSFMGGIYELQPVNNGSISNNFGMYLSLLINSSTESTGITLTCLTELGDPATPVAVGITGVHGETITGINTKYKLTGGTSSESVIIIPKELLNRDIIVTMMHINQSDDSNVKRVMDTVFINEYTSGVIKHIISAPIGINFGCTSELALRANAPTISLFGGSIFKSDP